jgi:hypothetical protein
MGFGGFSVVDTWFQLWFHAKFLDADFKQNMGILWDSKTIFEQPWAQEKTGAHWLIQLIQSWSIHSPIFRPSRYMVMLFWTILSYIISL